MPLFDAYLMVDWSAAAVPRTGADSIWWSLFVREGRRVKRKTTSNPPTRAQARTELTVALDALSSTGRRTLAGFDFPFAYPAGFAAALGLGTPSWRGVWDELSRRLRDDAANANNRFTVAGDLNRQVSAGTFPFWGHHPAHRWANVARHKPDTGALPEHRRVESLVRGPQPCWKLYGNGSVGSQALTGIPVVRALRQHFPNARAWPFETDFDGDRKSPIVFAEIYPSLFPFPQRAGLVKDRAQVETAARQFADADDDGTLRRWLAPHRDLAPRERDGVLAEEGWILGVA